MNCNNPDTQKVFSLQKHILDLSLYPPNHPVFTSNTSSVERAELLPLRTTTHKVLGRWACEVPANYALYDFMAFKPKSYSVQFLKICPPACFDSVGEPTLHNTVNHEQQEQNSAVWLEKQRFKGCVSKLLTYKHADYLNFLLGNDKFHDLYLTYQHVTIVSKKHRLYLQNSRKIVTNRLINKRYLLADQKTSLPFGHKDIADYEICWQSISDIIVQIENQIDIHSSD